MNNLLRLLIACVLVAFAVAILSLGMARQTNNLDAPFILLLLIIGLGFYFMPTMLALYRNCHATSWIAMINVLFGWTIVGWFAAIGWAATGKTDTFPPTITAPPRSPITGH
jgi:hypothetical protein